MDYYTVNRNEMNMPSQSETIQKINSAVSYAQGPINIINLEEMENQVKATMEESAFEYIRGGVEDEKNLRQNSIAFEKKYIMPRGLKGLDFSQLDLTTDFLNMRLMTPIIQAPMAVQGLAHQQGEIATAKGMAKAGSLFSLSTYGNKTIKEVSDVSEGYPFLFQLYMSKNDVFNEYILTQAKQQGAKGIIFTIDSTIGGHREGNIRSQFEFPADFANFDQFNAIHNRAKSSQRMTIDEIFEQAKQTFIPADIQYIKQVSNLPVIVKGIECIEDAEIAIQAGADAIWVSNHGGRQLDSAPASINVLPLIAKTVNKRVPIVFDSGVRRGSHVFKALASGADIVAVGRPILYGLHLGGSEGAYCVIEHLNKELKINMMLGGKRNIKEVQATRLLTDADFNL